MRLIIIKWAALCGLLFYLPCCYNTGMAEFENKSQASQNVQAVGGEQLPNVWELDARDNTVGLTKNIRYPICAIGGTFGYLTTTWNIANQSRKIPNGTAVPMLNNAGIYDSQGNFKFPRPGLWEVSFDFAVMRDAAGMGGYCNLNLISAPISPLDTVTLLRGNRPYYMQFDLPGADPNLAYIRLNYLYYISAPTTPFKLELFINGTPSTSVFYSTTMDSLLIRYVGN